MTPKRERPGANNTEALSDSKRMERSEHSNESVGICHACGAVMKGDREALDLFLWDSETAGKLSKHLPVRVLATYLTSAPCAHPTGLYKLARETILTDTGLTAAEFEAAKVLLMEMNFAQFDEGRKLVWVPPLARYVIGEMQPSDKRLIPLLKSVKTHKDHPFFEALFKVLEDTEDEAEFFKEKGGSKGRNKGGNNPSHAPSQSEDEKGGKGGNNPSYNPCNYPSEAHGRSASGLPSKSDQKQEAEAEAENSEQEAESPASVPPLVDMESEIQRSIEVFEAKDRKQEAEHIRSFRRLLKKLPGGEDPRELRRRIDRFFSEEATVDPDLQWIWRKKLESGEFVGVNRTIDFLAKANVWAALGLEPSKRNLKHLNKKPGVSVGSVLISGDEDLAQRPTDPDAMERDLRRVLGDKN